MDEIIKYFPDLTAEQIRQFGQLDELYASWNEKINIISRKDIDNLYLHHVLHSLAIAKFITPVAGTQFIDLGCGGGFPGIPLAIMWPHCKLHLIDRIGKKVRVAQAVADAVGLTNVTTQHGDSGECKLKTDFVVSRAVMELPELCKASARLLAKKSHNSFPNGLLCLKGGDLADEVASVKHPNIEVPLTDYFSEEYFATKELIYVEL